ncbi:MAG: outer membrane lipoprotein carrier protein LolA [Nitrospinota bacterium]
MERVQTLVVTLGAALWLMTTGAQGVAQDLQTVVEGVQARYQQTHFFQARFRQTSVLASLGERLESAGRVYIRKPGMMRWEYEGPERQLLVSDGLSFWVYTPKLKQVIASRFGETFRSKTPLAFLAGNGDIRREFNVRFREKRPEAGNGAPALHRLSLIPKKPHPSLKELRLDVRKEDYLIVRSSLIDPYGNVTDIQFENIRVDEALPQDLFTFRIPPGVEVVHPPPTPGSR